MTSCSRSDDAVILQTDANAEEVAGLIRLTERYCVVFANIKSACRSNLLHVTRIQCVTLVFGLEGLQQNRKSCFFRKRSRIEWATRLAIGYPISRCPPAQHLLLLRAI